MRQFHETTANLARQWLVPGTLVEEKIPTQSIGNVCIEQGGVGT